MRTIGNLSATNWRDLPAILRSLLPLGGLLDGPQITAFENDFVAFQGGGHAVSFRAARMGLSAILQAAGLKAGDEVLVTGFTCVVVPNAAIFQGIRPVYVDIDPDTFNMIPEDVERKITDRTRAIIIQSSFGMPPDFDAILPIARQHGLFVIEDNALSMGARYHGKLLGTLGDAAIFSGEQTKSISIAKGGLAYTSSEAFAEKLREIRKSAAWPEPATVRKELGFMANLALLQGPGLYKYTLPEYYLRRLGLIYLSEWQGQEWTCAEPANYMQRLSNAHARVGRSQLRQLPRLMAKRRHYADLYRERLAEMGYRLPKVLPDCEPSIVTFPLLVKDRDHLRTYMRARDIMLGDWFQAPVHPTKVKPEDAMYHAGSCPNAEQVSRHVVNLPTHVRMTDADANRLIAALAQYNAEFPEFAPQPDNPVWPFEASIPSP
ncbi:MAG: DegT/DnrJ/EryC1/StrS family aminotransferase [Gammaproteobacteria bacterium]